MSNKRELAKIAKEIRQIKSSLHGELIRDMKKEFSDLDSLSGDELKQALLALKENYFDYAEDIYDEDDEDVDEIFEAIEELIEDNDLEKEWKKLL